MNSPKISFQISSRGRLAVVGLNAKSLDVVWDVPFMSGGTLGNRYLLFFSFFFETEVTKYSLHNRCSQYWGSTVEFNSCLNLTNPQFVTSTNRKAPPPVCNNVPFNPRFDPYPAIQPSPGRDLASGFRPAPNSK